MAWTSGTPTTSALYPYLPPFREFKSAVTIENTYSWGNGFNRWNFEDFEGDGNGFKLGGGDASEDITVHEVPREEAPRWLAQKMASVSDAGQWKVTRFDTTPPVGTA